MHMHFFFTCILVLASVHMTTDASVHVNLCVRPSYSQICINNHLPPAPSDLYTLAVGFGWKAMYSTELCQTETLGGKASTDVDRESYY